VLTLDSAGTSVTGAQKIFANHPFSNPTDFRVGPDGALYVLNYGPGFFNANGSAGIEKISYKGDCRPSAPKLEPVVGLARQPDGSVDERPSGMLANLGPDRVVLVPQGMIGFELFRMDGTRVWDAGGLGGRRSFRLPAGLKTGGLKYRWTPERR
jgi:hypothetical protein